MKIIIKVCKGLNYIEHFLIFISADGGCVWSSAFASLVGVPVGIANSTVGIKICAISVWIKNYKSVIKKNRKKHDKIVLLAKTKLITIKILVSKALMNSYINHDEYVSVNNVLREYDEMTEEIKILENYLFLFWSRLLIILNVSIARFLILLMFMVGLPDFSSKVL